MFAKNGSTKEIGGAYMTIKQRKKLQGSSTLPEHANV